MKQVFRALAVAAMVVIAISPAGALAAAVCNGVVTGAHSGGLVVHAGDICDVENATVSGGIQMDGGTLTICHSTISGGIAANILPTHRSSSWVIIGQNLEEGGELSCPGNTISGGVNLQYVQGLGDGCCGDSVQIESNNITGGVTLKNNGSSVASCLSFSVELEGNMIDGGCHASDNACFTNDGVPNTIHGGADGQCKGL
jgi:hypothetical protein